jgi:hypothetical protein
LGEFAYLLRGAILEFKPQFPLNPHPKFRKSKDRAPNHVILGAAIVQNPRFGDYHLDKARTKCRDGLRPKRRGWSGRNDSDYSPGLGSSDPGGTC